MDRTHAPVSDDHKQGAFTRLETITALAVVGVLALALGLIALAMPTTGDESHSVRYHQSGAFRYSANAPADSVYGPRGVRTGDPILGAVAGPVTAGFDYHLITSASKQVRGTSGMVATVHTAQGLTRDFSVAARASFTGGRVRISGVLPVGEITEYVRQVEEASGGTGGPASTVVVTPRIIVRGSLDGHRLATAFAPELSFDVDGGTLRLTQPVGAVDPDAALRPTEGGKVAYRAVIDKTFSLVLVEPTVDAVRIAGVGIGLVCLLLALWVARPLWRPRGEGAESARIHALYGSRLVDVRNLTLREGPVADVSDMDALAEIAKRYESMILHVSEPEAYLVWDNGMLYRYRPVTALRPVAQHVAREA